MTDDAVEAIRLYVLHSDRNGLHLRQLAEKMAEQEPAPRGYAHARARQEAIEKAAGTIARFLYLVWGLAGPDEYAPRMYERLMNLQRRMRGMDPNDTWDYALSAMGEEVRQRLRKAANVTIDPEMETALTHRFFDSLQEHTYLHDVVERIMDLHWTRRHGPGAITVEEFDRSAGRSTPRGSAEIERHLQRLAMEGLATYIEQANIGWGNIDEPTDPTVVLRERIEIQLALGGKDAHTWEESAWRLADLIERRFGTAAAREQARAARAGWNAVAPPPGQEAEKAR